jgi:hypothetical protein
LIAYEIDASGPQEVLKVLGLRLDDCSEPIREILTLALQDSRQEIISQGELFGSGWAPMSPWTNQVSVALYGRGRDPRTLLYDSRGLLDALTPEQAGNVFEVGPKTGIAGADYRSKRTGFDIGKWQQNGTDRTFHVLQGHGYSETGIPARPFLGWHESRADEYVGIFAQHILPADA